ncbi:Uncharacterised protein [Providencia heimbachae]|nr:Uncharacterised protein [Providencia heimbachae]
MVSALSWSFYPTYTIISIYSHIVTSSHLEVRWLGENYELPDKALGNNKLFSKLI